MEETTYTIATNDRKEAARLMHADDAYSAIWDIQQEIRQMTKYDVDNKISKEKALERISEIIVESNTMEYWD